MISSRPPRAVSIAAHSTMSATSDPVDGSAGPPLAELRRSAGLVKPCGGAGRSAGAESAATTSLGTLAAADATSTVVGGAGTGMGGASGSGGARHSTSAALRR
jgi:hypothetical protein